MRGIFCGTCAAAAMLLAAGTACAQETEGTDQSAAELVTESGAIVGYAPGFFIAFSPVTALDMVSRVPGFSLSSGDTGRRGLGDSFGNLLVNGERPSNKSISLQTVLQRIPVADVERIELVREADGTYDMRGHSRLVNVVLREGAGNSGSWRGRLNYWNGSNRYTPEGEISYSTHWGDTEVTFGLSNEYRGPRMQRRHSLRDGTGNLLETGQASDQRTYWEFNPSFSFNMPLGENTSLRLDSRGWFWQWNRQQAFSFQAPDPTGNLVPSRYEHSDTSNYGRGITGTLTLAHEFGNGVESETVLLVRREQWEDGPEPYRVFSPAGFLGGSIFEAEGRYQETVLRQSLSFDPSDNHALEVGVEGAFNARDSFLRLDFIPAATPFVDDTLVEESRAEIFGNHVWTINDRFSLESGLRYEFSEISQSGGTTRERTFSYPKPSVTLSWTPSDDTRWRFSLERDVDQLDFSKFASSINVTDNNTILGNPNYVPQRTWTIEAEWQRSFDNDASWTIRVGHEWIQDLDDFIPIVTPNGVFDAPGNVGDGTNFRVTTEWSTPLDGIGLSNAVLTGFVEWYNTNVTDPLTGMDRHFSHTREWEVRFDYRQTFPEHDLAWGWDYYWLSDGAVFRSQELRHYGFTDGDLDVYVETTRWEGITARLGVNQLINNGEDRERIFYNGSRATGGVTGIENQNASFGPEFYVELRGTF
ncbi:TonB-dependent receptor plug domain-containing protein [Hyphobacterium marinum]|uniref:TonB-dependent receptor n=1 Tax=Hyphobacterium marinum TaxID=3116574 RepID=A0ABU7LWT0_9PROT|nr:TonB-dependent receptor [Hyphobacterium sp. Y6023]MEE2566002.1 TonB-dependent receptor [Hyphobacterium sp. Y6023]